MVKRYWTKLHGTSKFSNENVHLDKILIKDNRVLKYQDGRNEKPGILIHGTNTE